MSINSRQKGKRGELYVVRYFVDNGYDPDARRGQQFAGGADSPDVILPNIPKLHVEVKFAQRINIYDAIKQSIRDSGDLQVSSVWLRKKNEELLVVLRAAEIDRFVSMWHHDVLTQEYYDRAILRTPEL